MINLLIDVSIQRLSARNLVGVDEHGVAFEDEAWGVFAGGGGGEDVLILLGVAAAVPEMALGRGWSGKGRDERYIGTVPGRF